MKKLYVIVALFAISFTAFSQGRTVDLSVDEILSPKSVHSGIAIIVHAVVKNNGPDDIKTTDTIAVRGVFPGVSTTLIGIRPNRELKMDDTLHVRLNVQPLTVNGTQHANFCMDGFALNRSGGGTGDSIKIEIATIANNRLCETIWYTDGQSSVSDLNKQINDATISPNPVQDAGIIRFTNPEASDVTVEVVDLAGKVVKTETFGHMGAGEQELELNFSGMKSGIYFYRLTSGEFTTTKKFAVQ